VTVPRGQSPVTLLSAALRTAASTGAVTVGSFNPVRSINTRSSDTSTHAGSSGLGALQLDLVTVGRVATMPVE
jgi:hypothetical protein